jgi:hypothetical protein
MRRLRASANLTCEHFAARLAALADALPLRRRSLAVLQTGLASHWLWRSTWENAVVPSEACGWAVHYFAVLQRGKPAAEKRFRGFPRDWDPTHAERESAALLHAAAAAGGGPVLSRVRLLDAPQLAAAGSWKSLAGATTVGSPKNLLMQYHLLREGMREVLLAGEAYDWRAASRPPACPETPSTDAPSPLSRQGAALARGRALVRAAAHRRGVR